LPSNLRPVTR